MRIKICFSPIKPLQILQRPVSYGSLSRISAHISLFLLSTILSTPRVRAQQSGTLRFEDYPVTEVFTGTPAAPILTTQEQRRY